MRRTWPLLAILLLSACPKPAAPLLPVPSEHRVVTPEELAQLTLPPTPSSLEVFERLAKQADEGDAAAAWQRAHYLLDLFDSVRFANDEVSRKALAKIAGRPLSAMKGSAATTAIAELILLEIDHVLELDRTHSLAGQARSLIRFDAAPPKEQTQVFQRVEELKRVMAKHGELETAARLRLFGYCRQALQDADGLAGTRRRVALSHCLYPLYASDPEPYFADAASDRPPPPERAELIIDMGALLEHSPATRLDAAVKAQRSWLDGFASAATSRVALDPVQLRLPPATGVSPYDDYPLLGVTKGDVAVEAAALHGPLMRDQRRVVALPYASETPASETLRAAAIAAAAGATTLAVLVSTQQRLSVPKGDYGSSRLQGDQAARVGEIHWSLALIEGLNGDGESDTAEAKATAWDPRRAALRLHLHVSPKQWRLTSPQGDLKVIDTSTTITLPQNLLRKELKTIRQAFPDEDGLVLVPDTGASHGALVAAGLASRADAKGNALFSQLAISTEAPKARSGKGLIQQIQRRAAAEVSVTPQTLESRNPVALRCYLELHNKGRAPRGEIRMELGPDDSIVTSGRGAALVLCAKKAYGGAMIEAKIPSVSVKFSAQAK